MARVSVPVCPFCGVDHDHLIVEHFTWLEGQNHDLIRAHMAARGLDPDRTSAIWFNCPLGHWFPHITFHADDPYSIACNVFDVETGEPAIPAHMKQERPQWMRN